MFASKFQKLLHFTEFYFNKIVHDATNFISFICIFQYQYNTTGETFTQGS